MTVMVALHTPAGQLLKLPALVTHYMKHQKLEGISFFVFLEDHYVLKHQDADQPEDEQLPFKAAITYTIGYAIVTATVHTPVVIPLAAIKKGSYANTDIPRMFPGGIFHPPRTGLCMS